VRPVVRTLSIATVSVRCRRRRSGSTRTVDSTSRNAQAAERGSLAASPSSGTGDLRFVVLYDTHALPTPMQRPGIAWYQSWGGGEVGSEERR
jgi:hypothetical protein